MGKRKQKPLPWRQPSQPIQQQEIDLSTMDAKQIGIDRNKKRDESYRMRVLLKKAKPKHDMKVANYVTSARIMRVGKPFATDFHFPYMAVALGGSYAEKGFECVTSHPREPLFMSTDSKAPLHPSGIKKHKELCCHLYRTGRIIVCGASSEMSALVGMHLTMERIRTVFGWQLTLTNFKVSNVVTHFNLGYHLNLWALRDDGNCEYHPQLFPGLIHFPNGFSQKKPCVNIQSTGAVVVVGAKNFEAACEIANAIDWKKYKLK